MHSGCSFNTGRPVSTANDMTDTSRSLPCCRLGSSLVRCKKLSPDSVEAQRLRPCCIQFASRWKLQRIRQHSVNELASKVNGNAFLPPSLCQDLHLVPLPAAMPQSSALPPGTSLALDLSSKSRHRIQHVTCVRSAWEPRNVEFALAFPTLPHSDEAVLSAVQGVFRKIGCLEEPPMAESVGLLSCKIVCMNA